MWPRLPLPLLPAASTAVTVEATPNRQVSTLWPDLDMAVSVIAPSTALVRVKCRGFQGEEQQVEPVEVCTDGRWWLV